jgi:hypothetical protein
MTRVLIVAAVLAALVTLLLASGAPLAHTDGFTWDAPAKAKATAQPHGWKW